MLEARECSSVPLVRRAGAWAEAATVAAAAAPLALRERRAAVFRGMRGMGSARAQRPGGAARTEIRGFEESRCTALKKIAVQPVTLVVFCLENLHENGKRGVHRPGISLDAYLERQKIDTA